MSLESEEDTRKFEVDSFNGLYRQLDQLILTYESLHRESCEGLKAVLLVTPFLLGIVFFMFGNAAQERIYVAAGFAILVGAVAHHWVTFGNPMRSSFISNVQFHTLQDTVAGFNRFAIEVGYPTVRLESAKTAAIYSLYNQVREISRPGPVQRLPKTPPTLL